MACADPGHVKILVFIVFIDLRHLVNFFSLQRSDLKINPLGLAHIVSRTILSEKEL